MFEKEAEERAKKLEESQTLGVYDSDEDLARDSGWNDGEVAGYEQGFIDGANFGYNKANEWHYVKDKLPPEDVPLLCIRDGKIYVAWYWDGIYHDDKCRQVKIPHAWKEIILPEQ